MAALHPLRDNRLLLGLAAALLAAYLRLVFATSRVTLEGRALLQAAAHGEKPFVCVFWHGRLLGPAIVFRGFGKRAKVLISQHRDGELIARVIQALGYTSIRGSTDRDKRGTVKDKGGLAGLRDMVRSVKNGDTVGLTPDGPRGPRMRMSAGTLTLAQLSGAPIVPLAWSTTRAVVFNSWDRFLMPLPFGHFFIELGAPLFVARDLDDAAAQSMLARIEQDLNDLCARCDTRAGRTPTRPAPLASQEHAA